MFSVSVSIFHHLTKVEVKENRYKINKLISVTNYIVNRLRDLNHVFLGVLTLRDFFVIYAKCQAAMADVRNAVTQLTVHMNNRNILLSDLSTGRLTADIIALKVLKIYLEQITKYLLANKPTLRLLTSKENKSMVLL